MLNTDNNRYLSTPDNSPEAIARIRFAEPLASLQVIDSAVEAIVRKKQMPHHEAIASIAGTAFGSQDPTQTEVTATAEPVVPDLISQAQTAVEAAIQGTSNV